MQTKAQLAVVDVLMACRTLNNFGNQAMATLKHGVPFPIDDDERIDLQQAIKLLRQTLDCVDPFIFDTIQHVNKTAKKPFLYLV